VSSEGLLSEFLISSVFDGVYLESVGMAVDVMVLSEEIRDWIDSEGNEKGCVYHNLLIWDLST